MSCLQPVQLHQVEQSPGFAAPHSNRQIQHGLHPDVRVIEPEAGKMKLGIDQIRELLTEVALKPYEGRRKVFILEKADRVTEEGENALLKTLEEPAGETLLILVTSNLSALLPTIISRCQEVRFPPLPPGPLAAFLEKKRGFPPERARLLAYFSGGSVGLALKMDDAALLEERDRILEGAFEAIKRGGAAILDFAESWAKDREGLDGALGHLLSFIRDILAFQLTKREDLLQNGDRAEEIRRLSILLSSSAIHSFFEAVAEAKEGILRNWNLKLSMEVMLLKARKAILDVGCQMVDMRELERSPASNIQRGSDG
ncbi:MAG: ATP-binding protein [Candidatus Methylomirabilales bacterium]